MSLVRPCLPCCSFTPDFAAYTAHCACVARLVWWSAHRTGKLRSSDQTTHLDFTKLQATEAGFAHGLGRLMAALPGNQIFQLDVSAKTLAIPRLPERLEGLSIAHLSDFHMSGRIGPGYFRKIVECTNSLEPDLVAITGDIVDSAACLDWIAQTLGHLEARYGVYFVLGNHDRRVDVAELRRILERADCATSGESIDDSRSRMNRFSSRAMSCHGSGLPRSRAQRS